MTDRIQQLRDHLGSTSSSPGVYLMKSGEGIVIYVGKARNLKKRLSSYFLKKQPPDPKTVVLVQHIASFETILTATEQDALILEANLIRKYKPRYNVVLKDDKRYPILRLAAGTPHPYLSLVRKMEKDGALYFGPFSSATAVHRTLSLIDRTFQLRKCQDPVLKQRTRPCLNHQMNRCLAPCCLEVDPARYQEMVREIVLFLSGRAGTLIEKVREEMLVASETKNFELAATLRDKMFSLERIVEKQTVVSSDTIDRDILGMAANEHLVVFTLLFVRNGKLMGSRHFELPETMALQEETVSSFLLQYYDTQPFLPAEILLPVKIEDALILEARLREVHGKKVQVLFPQRGEKTRLTALATENAVHHLKEATEKALSGADLLLRLKHRLGLARMPNRIECFDNSNLFGESPVAGKVVFEGAKPKKSDYRKYVIKSVIGPDDYASMAEILSRRFRPKETPEPLPDLLMVDGGKGQLNVAVSILESLGLSGAMDVAGIAKKDAAKGEVQDKIFLPGRSNPVVFQHETDLLLFLQRIRDEAHRFAITFHQKSHRGKAVASILDEIPGIGKARKVLLLKEFRSIDGIRKAPVSRIAELPGFSEGLAEKIQSALASPNGGGDATSG